MIGNRKSKIENPDKRVTAAFLVCVLLLGGCGSIFQESDVALIREPGHRTYSDPPEKVAVSAKYLWEYAVLSDNVYLFSTVTQMAKAEEAKACSLERTERLVLQGWERWRDVPNAELTKEAEAVDLQLEIWEKQSSPPVVAVVFRGTEAQRLRDWISNFRWFLRFIPGYRDQYVLVSEKIGAVVLNKIKAQLEKGNTKYRDVQIVSAGHSLGGGLAQHLAYSLPDDIKGPNGERLPRVSAVYGFDPSPVTGWYSVSKELREMNARGLHIARVFEHGEILSYIRLILRYLNPPQEKDPSIREIRYNFVRTVNPFSSHSMRLIACELIKANGQSTAPIQDPAKEAGK
jgi:Lipase (class 3)